MSNLNELREQRGRLVSQMRGILDTAEAENRDLTDEEVSKYEAMEADQDRIAAKIARLENLEGIEGQINRVTEVPVQLRPEQANVMNARATEEYGNAFMTYVRQGGAASNQVLGALQVGTDSEGGYIVPEEFETMLVEGLQDINEFRSMIDVVSTAGDRNIPIENTLGTATWTAEEAAYTESDAAFGQVVLGANKLATIIRVSEELLQDAFFDLQAYLARNFAKRFGIAEEAAIVNGTGSGQPTGLTDGSSLGVTAAGAAAITADEMIDLYHSLGRPYRNNATFIAHDDTVKLIRKLKDGDNQYLWQPGLQAGQPDRILGRPFIASTAAEAATTGLKSVLFGDLSYYVLAERSGRVFQRLNELYAANGQVGFRMFERLDGALTLSAAVKHLIQA